MSLRVDGMNVKLSVFCILPLSLPFLLSHANVQSYLLIILQYQPISLQCSGLSDELLIRFWLSIVISIIGNSQYITLTFFFITHCIALATAQQRADLINKIHIIDFTETNHGRHLLSQVPKEGYGIVSFLLGQWIDFLFIIHPRLSAK